VHSPDPYLSRDTASRSASVAVNAVKLYTFQVALTGSKRPFPTLNAKCRQGLLIGCGGDEGPASDRAPESNDGRIEASDSEHR
jgi:hypothetical protein